MDKNWEFIVEKHATPEAVYGNYTELVEALQNGLRIIRESGAFPSKLQSRLLAEVVYTALLTYYNK